MVCSRVSKPSALFGMVKTSVYRFRLLTEEEEAEAMAAWSGAHEEMIVDVARRDGSDGTLPAS